MEIPKPGPHKMPAAKSMENVGVAAVETAAAMNTLVEANKTSKAQKPSYVRKPHLTHRPFINPKLVSLRAEMQHPNKKK